MSWCAGDTYIPYSNQIQDEEHLHFIVSKILSPSNKVLTVNLTSWHEKGDNTCILNVGDHPFVTHKSFILYNKATILTTEQLDDAEHRNLIYRHNPASKKLLERIQAGVVASVRTPYWIKDSLKD